MGRETRRIKADGDTWSVRLGEESDSDDERTMLFFCVTTSQRPYRVLRLSRERLPDESALEALSDEGLRECFAASRSMDFPRDYDRSSPPGS